MSISSEKAGANGAWLLCLAALVALTVSVINAFNKGNGIAFTAGSYLVVITSALLVVGAVALIWSTSLPRAAAVVFAILVLLDILGTGFAAWLLEAYVLFGAIVVAGIAWLIYLVFDPARERYVYRAVR
ncbi:glycerol-3-phosphate acyltransferase PlsY [Amorphus suaedae]